MTRTFETMTQAQAALSAQGFKTLGSYWVKPTAIATLHPVDRSDKVIVFVSERQRLAS